MSIWYDLKIAKDKTTRMKDMVLHAKSLFVWVSEEPCVMVLPLHCFHTVFTLSTACHSGVRAGSDLWQREMTEVIRSISDPQEQRFLRKDKVLLDRSMRQILPDIEVWIQWCKSIQRDPTERELEIMEALDPLIRVTKYNLRYFTKIHKG